ncbi:hypothetical protein [Kosakonia arachidis]|nr:hypothetical protein [Kosakonia arachidis]
MKSATFIVLILPCQTIFAENMINPGSVTSQAQHNPGLCGEESIDVFSCILESGISVSLCASTTPAMLKMKTSDTSSPVHNLTITDAKKLSEHSPSGGVSIIVGSSEAGPVTSYLYFGRGDDDINYSAIKISDKNAELCKVGSSFTHYKKIKNTSEEINLWNLDKVGITTDFEPQGSQNSKMMTRALWDSWPKKVL